MTRYLVVRRFYDTDAKANRVITWRVVADSAAQAIEIVHGTNPSREYSATVE